MAKNITWLGNQYSNVGYVDLPQTGGGTARFDDASVTTATASDVASGKIFLASDGTITTGTASGGGGTDFIVTLSYDSQSDMWTPDCTYAELYSAYSGGKSIAWVCDDNSVAYGYFAVNEFDYYVYEYFEDSDGEGFVVHSHGFSSSGVTDYGRTDKYYGIYDATALPTDVANGKIFYNANGRQTGTASGGGGASNIVTGTFTTPSTTSANGTVDVPYTGTGYPIALVIYVEGGMYNSAISGWYNSLVRYAVGQFVITKGVATTAPSYGTSGSANYGSVQVMYKNSTSSATTYTSTRAATTNSYSSNDANGTSTLCVRWRSNTRFSYRTAGGTSSTYGLLADTTYRYCVLYSE